MNDKIESILADLDIDLYTDDGVMMTKILVSPKDLRQFAEEVARNCMRICSTEYRTNDGWGLTRGDVRCHYAIATHFGIEPNTSYTL